MAEGALIVNAKKQIRVQFTNRNGKQVEMAVRQTELSRQLGQLPLEELNGRQVELDEEAGQPKRVRPVGESFAAGSGQPAAQPAQQREQPSGRPPRQSPEREFESAFHNPYNFVPALPRERVSGELRDRQPLGHHVLHPDCFSGVIRVKMTVKTPLLVPDAAQVVDLDEDHKSFPIRVDSQGRPHLAATSVKGMLRAAYEAVTNSRMAVFAGHDDKLAYRMPTQEGLSLVPARVQDGRLVLLPGTSSISSNSPNDPLYAAWLPRYFRGRLDRNAVRYPNKQLPAHRDEVECWIELVQHWRWDRRRNQHKRDFRYWRVRQIVQRGQQLGSQPSLSRAPEMRCGRSYHEPLGEFRHVSGFVCVTYANIDGKHDERVFFTTSDSPVTLQLNDKHVHDWKTLIADYQREHAEEIRQGRDSPRALSNSEWSRQIVGINNQPSAETKLSDGTLLYAQVDRIKEGWRICGLYPVNISRKLHPDTPIALLPLSLQPATSLAQLSPAERVFGWVNQQGKGAYRGNLRISPVTCNSDDAIQRFGSPGLPLAILGQPKPQQTRFYVASSPDGKAQDNGVLKEEVSYRRGKGLRGRKVYPHHRALPNGHWDQPMTDRTQQPNRGHFQEYRRPQNDDREQRDSQNRSIQGWVKPSSVFTFNLHVTNLSSVELGALLWLLSLPEEHFHRLGSGKPLGFGSVRLEIESSRLYDGGTWKQIYSTLDDLTPDMVSHDTLIDNFKQALRAAYQENEVFEKVAFIEAWLRMASGHPDSLPIHYPRARQMGQAGPVPPHPDGVAYQWFVANDRPGRHGGPHMSLPDLAADQGLPMLEAPRTRG